MQNLITKISIVFNRENMFLDYFCYKTKYQSFVFIYHVILYMLILEKSQ